MMRHYCAMQRRDTGRWDYTCGGVSVGYCREYAPIKEDCGWMHPEQVRAYNEKMAALAGKFHSDSHATEEEAQECYKQYMLDTALRLQTAEPENAMQQFKCKVCGKWTACHAFVGPYRIFELCPEHQTREHVEKLYSVGESWES